MMSKMWKTGTLVAIALTATATVAAQQPPPPARQRRLIGQGRRHRMYSARDSIARRHDGDRRPRGGRRLEVHPDESLARVGRDGHAKDVSARRRRQPVDSARQPQGGNHRHARREAGRRRSGRAREAEGRLGEDGRRQLRQLASHLDILGECSQTHLGIGPAHGHEIIKAIERSSEDVLRVEQGSLYPALHRLIKRGWIDFDHGTSENNRRAKYDRLTRKAAGSSTSRRRSGRRWRAP